MVLDIIGSTMLSFHNRFHGHGALRYVYKNGTARYGSIMTVKSVVNNRRKTPRIAVVVGKKVLKSAVGRNRIRRRIYELFREDLHVLRPNSDIVCIVTSAGARTIDHEALKSELQSLLREAKLYDNTV